MSSKWALIVDDLAMIRASLKCLIKDSTTLEVHETGTLEEAKLWLSSPKNLKNLSVILCDYKLADGTVLDLLQHLLDLKSQVPIYCLSPDKENSIVREALAQGVCDVFQKPLHLGHMKPLQSHRKVPAA